jgi:hypothetical protein
MDQLLQSILVSPSLDRDVSFKTGELVDYGGRTDPGFNEENGTAKIISPVRNFDGSWRIEMVLTKKVYVVHESRLTRSMIFSDGRGARRKSKSPSSSNSVYSVSSGTPSPGVISIDKENVPAKNNIHDAEKRIDVGKVVKFKPRASNGSNSLLNLGIKSTSLKVKQPLATNHQNGKGSSIEVTVWPQVGDAVKVIYDEKDWYNGVVTVVSQDKKEITVSFEDGEVETIAYPCADVILMLANGQCLRNDGR